MKKIILGIVAFLFLVTPAFAVAPNWNVTGSYVIDYEWNGNHYLNDVTLSQIGGNVTGTMGYPSGSNPYLVLGDVAGSVSGDTFTFTVQYNDRSYIRNDSGTITSSGMSGNWDDATTSNNGSWTITSTMKSYCTKTGFYVDGFEQTAALINPVLASGKIDATGCNIGVYFDQNGTVNNAEIFGANYFGIVNRGAAVDVTNSKIHDIGNGGLYSEFNGTQHGRAIYFASEGTTDGYWSPNCIGNTTGNITGNIISSYQKSGIVGFCKGTDVTITNNTIDGIESVLYIARNGITVSSGAVAHITGNRILNNSYSGPNGASSGGVLLVGSSGLYTVGTQINNNVLNDNDVGVYLYNADNSGLAPVLKTNNKVINNTITNNNCSNTTGWDASNGYQAGISEMGKSDKLINNTISGNGYTTDACENVKTYVIDALGSNPVIHANVIP